MARVVLLTGGNLGDKTRSLALARETVDLRIGRVICGSAVYESEPWGFSADETFLNQVLVIETDLEPVEVLDAVQDIEKGMGRRQIESPTGDGKRVYESRPIDIDILFFDDLILNTPRLTIPHPLIAEREFVLIPLREILPDYVHPVLKKRIRDL